VPSKERSRLLNGIELACLALIHERILIVAVVPAGRRHDATSARRVRRAYESAPVGRDETSVNDERQIMDDACWHVTRHHLVVRGRRVMVHTRCPRVDGRQPVRASG
jgi:hypothetical protein